MDAWVRATAAEAGLSDIASVEKLSGGYINAVFRVTTDSRGHGAAGSRRSAVLKISPPFIATNPAVPFSADRQAREELALRLMAPEGGSAEHSGLLASCTSGLPVRCPAVLVPGRDLDLPAEAAAWMSGSVSAAAPGVWPCARVLVMEDLGTGPALTALLEAWRDGPGAPSKRGPLPTAGEASVLLGALGAAVRRMHEASWGLLGAGRADQAGGEAAPPAAPELGARPAAGAGPAVGAVPPAATGPVPSAAVAASLRSALRNQDVQDLRRGLQYGRVAAAVRSRVAAPWGGAMADDLEGLGRSLAEEEGCCLVMGDLWPASVVLVPPSGAEGAAWEAGLIDWEFCHWGDVGQDVGHIVGHLLMWAHAHAVRAAEAGAGAGGPGAGAGPLGLEDAPAFALLVSFLEGWRDGASGGVGCPGGAGARRTTLRHAAAEILARSVGAFVGGYVYDGAGGGVVDEAVATAAALWAASRRDLDAPAAVGRASVPSGAVSALIAAMGE